MIALAATAFATAAALAPTAPVATLSASPERVVLAPGAIAPVVVANHGPRPLVLDVTPAGVALDLRGRPRLVRGPRARQTARRLDARPRLVVLRPRSRASVILAAKGAWPRAGDHHGVVLLASRPHRRGRVSVRLRLGVRVVVRVPGRIVRRLSVRSVRVRRGRAIDVLLANLGNVTERVDRATMSVTVRPRRARSVALAVPRRELLPRSSALLSLRHGPRLRGRVTLVVELRRPRLVRRAFVLRL